MLKEAFCWNLVLPISPATNAQRRPLEKVTPKGWQTPSAENRHLFSFPWAGGGGGKGRVKMLKISYKWKRENHDSDSLPDIGSFKVEVVRYVGKTSCVHRKEGFRAMIFSSGTHPHRVPSSSPLVFIRVGLVTVAGRFGPEAEPACGQGMEQAPLWTLNLLLLLPPQNDSGGKYI